MFIDRDTSGNIVGRFALQQRDGQEWIADDSPELSYIPKEKRIEARQAEYDNDLEELNKAWLSALIADGEGEASRQAIVKQQMSDLESELEQDILTILMEE